MSFGRTISGAVLLATARLISRVLDFVALLVLARFLTPADFGVVAVAMTLITVIEAVLELPVGLVLIRLPVLDQWDLDTAFTLAAIRAVALSMVVALLAWPFAIIYQDPRLCGLICLLSLAPAARGLVSPGMVVFAKRLNFKPDFIVEVSGKLAALTVTVSAAMSTTSYWAIVAGTLTAPLTASLVSYVLAPYRPRLSLKRWRVFAGFLGWASASQAVSAINWQCDRLVLGKFISHSELGQFSMASDLAAIPFQMLVTPIMRSVMPVFVSFEAVFDRLQAAFEKTVVGIAVVTVPLMVGLSLLADPGVRLALGGKWLTAVPILQWIALGALPALFVAPLSPLAVAMNQTHIFLRLNAVELLFKVPLVAIGALWFGIAGVVAVRIASAVLIALVSMAFTRQLIGLSIMRQVFAPWRAMASAGLMAVVITLMRPALSHLVAEDLASGLVKVILAGGATYLSTLLLLWRLSGRPTGIEASSIAILRRYAASSLRLTVAALKQSLVRTATEPRSGPLRKADDPLP